MTRGSRSGGLAVALLLAGCAARKGPERICVAAEPPARTPLEAVPRPWSVSWTVTPDTAARDVPLWLQLSLENRHDRTFEHITLVVTLRGEDDAVMGQERTPVVGRVDPFEVSQVGLLLPEVWGQEGPRMKGAVVITGACLERIAAQDETAHQRFVSEVPVRAAVDGDAVHRIDVEVEAR